VFFFFFFTSGIKSQHNKLQGKKKMPLYKWLTKSKKTKPRKIQGINKKWRSPRHSARFFCSEPEETKRIEHTNMQ